jgi:hypothetical protein
MFFEGGHPVPVYTLANAVVGAIASQTGIKTTVQDVAEMFYAKGRDGQSACGLDWKLNKWCLRVEMFEGATTVTMPNGETFIK